MGKDSEFGRIIKLLKKQGWRIEQRKQTSHYVFYAPNGKDMVFCANTPSDHRARKNMVSDLRKKGARI